ncbi:hypothetical protein ACN27G_09910 [Plantactinospora sp. WMMB334]|uniref:hypothetical protein n=1 Tax=Plantactinospora sp. WMMB334 TaxID=3404119 RepID=UPI003B94EFB6
MDEKERYDTDREARRDAAGRSARSAARGPDAITRFVGALLYDSLRRIEREREEDRNRTGPSGEGAGAAA